MSNPLVLLHGFLGSSADWQSTVQSPQLAKRTMIVPDIEPADSWQDGIAALAIQIPPGAILLGYSMGARLALACAIDARIPIAGLMLISGNPGIDKDARPARWQHDQAIADRLRLCTTLDDTARFLDDWYRQPVFESLSPTHIQEIVASKRTLDQHRQAALMQTYSIAKQPNYWPELGKLSLPVLVIAGQKDTKYVEIANRFATTCEYANQQIVSNAGHIVYRENLTEFLSLSNEFLLRTSL